MKTVRLGEVADYVNGAAFKQTDWEAEGRRIIRIQNLNDPSKPFNRTTKQVKDSIVVRPGDLLVSWSASLGVYRWGLEDEAVLNQHIFRVVPDTSVVDQDYLRRVLGWAIERIAGQAHGATMKHLTRKVFLGFQIPLPPIEEQRRIASILDAADNLRTKRRQALAKLDTLTQAIFIDMFGDPGVNPQEWVTAPLNQILSKIDNGKSPVCRDRVSNKDEWGVLKAGAVSYCKFDASQNKALPDGQHFDPSKEVKHGDLLFGRKNTHELVAASAYVYRTRPKLLMSDLIFRLRLKPDAGVEPVFLQQQLIHPYVRKAIQRLAGGSSGSMPNISKSKLLTVRVFLPPVDLQKEFVSRVHEAEDLKQRNQDQTQEQENLFASLQQKAFRGEL